MNREVPSGLLGQDPGHFLKDWAVPVLAVVRMVADMPSFLRWQMGKAALRN